MKSKSEQNKLILAIGLTTFSLIAVAFLHGKSCPKQQDKSGFKPLGKNMIQLIDKAKALYKRDCDTWPYKSQKLPSFEELNIMYKLAYLDAAITMSELTPNPAFKPDKIEYYWKENA